VRGSGADLGALIDAGCERLTLIDGRGRVLSDDEAIMAFIELLPMAGEVGRIALPVTASDRTVQRCRERGVELMVTPLSPSGLLEAAASGGVSFAADRRSGYVFPSFLPAFDAAAALARLVSLLEVSPTSLAEIVDATPPMPVLQEDVPTPMEQKGLVMRTLMEQLTEEGAELVLVDGIKAVSDQGWALIVPDPADPVTHVWAEGSDLATSEALVSAYVERIITMLP
jgi:mannose-1-phosphate guanylyltransferase/phosphomannomutase